MADIPRGTWCIDGRVAIQLVECDGTVFGRIVWLHSPRDEQGQVRRDTMNPNRALRERRLCGLTALWGLRPTGPDQWGGGQFYNPENGVTYRVSASQTSVDVITARIFIGMPLFGVTKTLRRVSLEKLND
jgi:uncharacterized protein (DUF2147 family)